MTLPISALEQNYQYGAFGALTGGRKITGTPAIEFTPAQRTGTNPYANLGTGEIISNYGDGGASAGAYKGLSNNPNDTVGAKFDTRKLGFEYGF